MSSSTRGNSFHDYRFGDVIQLLAMLGVGALMGIIAGTLVLWTVPQEWFPIVVSNPPIWAFFGGLIVGVLVFLILLYSAGSTSSHEKNYGRYYRGED